MAGNPTRAADAPALTIDLWFDIVCPFCYIGKRRLDLSLADFDRPVAFRYHAFQLAPDAPRQTSDDLNSLLQQRYGMSRVEAVAANARVAAMGATMGLRFDFASARWANTRDAHRLVKLAAAHGLGAAMLERLYQAFFEQGLTIGEAVTLVTLGAEVGLDARTVEQMLQGEDHIAEIADDHRAAMRAGVRSVPHYRIGDRPIDHQSLDLAGLRALSAAAF